METKFDLAKIGQDLVYVKPIQATDLPDEMRAEIGNLKEVFALHNASGEQLALVANHQLAFHLARENKMQPVRLH